MTHHAHVKMQVALGHNIQEVALLFKVTSHRETNQDTPYKEKMAWLICKDASIPLTEEQLEKILKRYDKNGDGKLSKQELKYAFKEMGLRFCGWKAGRAFHHADINGDGYINKEEMSELVKYASKWGIRTYQQFLNYQFVYLSTVVLFMCLFFFSSSFLASCISRSKETKGPCYF